MFLHLLDEVYQESMTYGILHSVFFLNFIVITGQRVGRVIIFMLFLEKLGPEKLSVLLEVTELQMERRIWRQVSDSRAQGFTLHYLAGIC